MGQIKNIKLHIVTDIKIPVIHPIVYQQLQQQPKTVKMSAFRPRSLFKVARNVNQVVRSYSSQSSGGGNAYKLPALFGSAVLAGSAVIAMKSEHGAPAFLPLVHASPPKPVGAPMERTFIMIKPDGVKRGLIADIIKRFEQRGYKLVAMKMLQADDELLNEHYA